MVEATSEMLTRWQGVAATGSGAKVLGDPDSANASRLLGDKTDVEMKTD